MRTPLPVAGAARRGAAAPVTGACSGFPDRNGDPRCRRSVPLMNGPSVAGALWPHPQARCSDCLDLPKPARWRARGRPRPLCQAQCLAECQGSSRLREIQPEPLAIRPLDSRPAGWCEGRRLCRDGTASGCYLRRRSFRHALRSLDGLFPSGCSSSANSSIMVSWRAFAVLSMSSL